MKTISINISQADVYQQVYAQAEYVAAKTASENLADTYARLGITETDLESLAGAWSNAVGAFGAVLRNDILVGQSTSDGYLVVFKVSEHFNDDNRDTLLALSTAFFANSILAYWYNLVFPERVATYSALAKQNLDEIAVVVKSFGTPVANTLRQDTGTKDGLITFTEASLLGEIKSRAYVEARIFESLGSPVASMLQDVGSEPHLGTVLMFVEQAFHKCEELLVAYLDEGSLREGSTYSMKLNLPPSCPPASLHNVAQAIKEYIVSYTLGQWLIPFEANRASYYLAKVEDCETMIRRAINTRRGKIQRTLRPF